MTDALWFLLLSLFCGWSALHLLGKRASTGTGASIMMFLFLTFACGFVLFLGVGFGTAFEALQSGAL